MLARFFVLVSLVFEKKNSLYIKYFFQKTYPNSIQPHKHWHWLFLFCVSCNSFSEMDIKYAFTGSQSEFLGELAVAARIYIYIGGSMRKHYQTSNQKLNDIYIIKLNETKLKKRQLNQKAGRKCETHESIWSHLITFFFTTIPHHISLHLYLVIQCTHAFTFIFGSPSFLFFPHRDRI